MKRQDGEGGNVKNKITSCNIKLHNTLSSLLQFTSDNLKAKVNGRIEEQ